MKLSIGPARTAPQAMPEVGPERALRCAAKCRSASAGADWRPSSSSLDCLCAGRNRRAAGRRLQPTSTRLMPVRPSLRAFRAPGKPEPDDRYTSILFSNGSRARLFFAVDALGCLRSLRARSALDGVSWVQGGLVEIAVSRWLAACNRIGAVVCSLPGASLLMELDLASCLVDLRGLGQRELRPVSQHRVHDDREAASQSNPRLAHR